MYIEIELPKENALTTATWQIPPNVSISCFESLEENLRFFDRENKEIIILQPSQT